MTVDFQPLNDQNEDQDLKYVPVTEETLNWFDFFTCIINSFVSHVENALLASSNFTLLTVNYITPILGLIRHMAMDETIYENIFDFLSKEPQFLSIIHQLLEKWPGK